MKTDYRNTSMLDMIFENRNKEYGAYVLRQDYDKNMKRAMGFTVTSILLVFGSVFIVNMLKASPIEKKEDVVITTTDGIKIHQPKPIEEPKIEEHRDKGKNTIRDTERRVVATEQAREDSIPDIHDQALADAGVTTNMNAGSDIGVENGTGENLNLEPVFTVEKPKETKPIIFAEVMPKFPGGEEALLKFLTKNTKYPDRELQTDIEGRVIVKFVVNEDGSISDANIVRSDSKGFSAEALRVVAKLPKFEPGRQQGKPVKVYYALPFIWRLNN